MSLFKDLLREEESLFTGNTEALDFDFIPKLVPFREQEQRTIASCIKPVFQKRNGRNIFVHGKPGIGKTVAIRHLLKELEEETEDIFPIYINCWQKNTSYKVFLTICDELGYKFTQNKKTEELATVIKEIINKNQGAVFVFDEVDKAEDLDFLYTLIEDIYRKSIILITNFQEWLAQLDERIRSRLQPEVLVFNAYDEKETIEILRQRKAYAFIPNVWKDDAFMQLAKKAAEKKDIRVGLSLLRTAGEHAESKAKRNIDKEDAAYALEQVGTEVSKNKAVDKEEEILLTLIKEHSGKKIGELFKYYTEAGNEISYKTFQRKIKKLDENNAISVEKKTGSEGNTTLVHYGQKTLKEF